MRLVRDQVLIDDWDELGYPAAPTRVFRTEQRNGDPLLRKQELFPCRYDKPAVVPAPRPKLAPPRAPMSWEQLLEERRRFG